MDCSPPGSSVHGIFQARILEWFAISFSLLFNLVYLINWASLVAQLVKNLPVVQKTQVRSLGWEDPLEKEMANLSRILSWKIPWTEESSGLQSMGSQSQTRLRD